MLDALKFVQGAIAKQDFIPELTHFHIANGRVTGFNGEMALSSPINLDINASPKALPFLKGIAACSEQTTMHLAAGSKIALQSGNFQAHIDCVENSFDIDFLAPEGEPIGLNSDFLSAIKKLAPFQSTDASRPWSNGILLEGSTARTTNNAVLVEYWLGSEMPVRRAINLPKRTVDELIRINQQPTHIQCTPNAITFHYDGERWLRSTLLAGEWPDIVGRLLDQPSQQTRLPTGISDALLTLKPFIEESGRIFMLDRCLRTSQHDGVGTSIWLQDLENDGCYHHTPLSLVAAAADTIDLTNYPKPAMFYAKNLRGVISGMIM